jgi:hypothetical protein
VGVVAVAVPSPVVVVVVVRGGGKEQARWERTFTAQPHVGWLPAARRDLWDHLSLAVIPGWLSGPARPHLVYSGFWLTFIIQYLFFSCNPPHFQFPESRWSRIYSRGAFSWPTLFIYDLSCNWTNSFLIYISLHTLLPLQSYIQFPVIHLYHQIFVTTKSKFYEPSMMSIQCILK